MNDLRIGTMRPDEISIAVEWAAAEGWNPGLADAGCFATVDPDGFLIGDFDEAPAATISCVNLGARFEQPQGMAPGFSGVSPMVSCRRSGETPHPWGEARCERCT